jgi:hypothetical protein
LQKLLNLAFTSKAGFLGFCFCSLSKAHGMVKKNKQKARRRSRKNPTVFWVCFSVLLFAVA